MAQNRTDVKERKKEERHRISGAARMIELLN